MADGGDQEISGYRKIGDDNFADALQREADVRAIEATAAKATEESTKIDPGKITTAGEAVKDAKQAVIDAGLEGGFKGDLKRYEKAINKMLKRKCVEVDLESTKYFQAKDAETGEDGKQDAVCMVGQDEVVLRVKGIEGMRMMATQLERQANQSEPEVIKIDGVETTKFSFFGLGVEAIFASYDTDTERDRQEVWPNVDPLRAMYRRHITDVDMASGFTGGTEVTIYARGNNLYIDRQNRDGLSIDIEPRRNVPGFGYRYGSISPEKPYFKNFRCENVWIVAKRDWVE